MRTPFLLICLLLYTFRGTNACAQYAERQFYRTSLPASGFFNGRKPVFYDGRVLYTISTPYTRAKARVLLYAIDVPQGSHQSRVLKMPADLSPKESNIIRDLVLTAEGLYIGLSGNSILHYSRTPGGDYRYSGNLKLPYGIDRMYLVGDTLICEEYYDYHPLDQQLKHVRMLIDLPALRLQQVLALDESSAPYTPVMNHFFDIHPDGRTLSVKSTEMKIMLGHYNRKDFSDSIEISRRFPSPCEATELLPAASGQVVANIKTLNELDKYCLERLEKALFLDTNLILASVNYPAADSNSVINRSKRLLILQKQARGWTVVLEQTVSLHPPEGAELYPPLFRAAYLYANGMEISAAEGRLLFLAYGKVLPPASPYYADAYKAAKDIESAKDKTINENVWLEIVNFSRP